MMVCKDHVANTAPKVLKVRRATRVIAAKLARMALAVSTARPVHPAILALLVSAENAVMSAHKASPVKTVTAAKALTASQSSPVQVLHPQRLALMASTTLMMSRTPSTARRRPEFGARRRAWSVRKARQVQAAEVVTVHLDRWDLPVLPVKMVSRDRKAHPAHKVYRASQVQREALELTVLKAKRVRQG